MCLARARRALPGRGRRRRMPQFAGRFGRANRTQPPDASRSATDSCSTLPRFAAASWAFGQRRGLPSTSTGDPLVRWDVEFGRWLHEHSNASLASAFKVFTSAGSVQVLALLTAGVALFLLRRGQLNEAALLCFGALGIEIVNPVLKLIFHRQRPELAYVHVDTYAFPSGHAAGSVVYALAFYLLARRARLHGIPRRPVTPPWSRPSGSAGCISKSTISPTCSRGSASGLPGRARASSSTSGITTSQRGSFRPVFVN